MQDWEREVSGGTMKDFVLKTDDRRGNPPSVLPELTGAMNVFRCDGSRWRGIVNFVGRFVGKGACVTAKIGGESRQQGQFEKLRGAISRKHDKKLSFASCSSQNNL